MTVQTLSLEEEYTYLKLEFGLSYAERATDIWPSSHQDAGANSFFPGIFTFNKVFLNDFSVPGALVYKHSLCFSQNTKAVFPPMKSLFFSSQNSTNALRGSKFLSLPLPAPTTP